MALFALFGILDDMVNIDKAGETDPPLLLCISADHLHHRDSNNVSVYWSVEPLLNLYPAHRTNLCSCRCEPHQHALRVQWACSWALDHPSRYAPSQDISVGGCCYGCTDCSVLRDRIVCAGMNHWHLWSISGHGNFIVWDENLEPIQHVHSAGNQTVWMP
jgi:hypothetical protein